MGKFHVLAVTIYRSSFSFKRYICQEFQILIYFLAKSKVMVVSIDGGVNLNVPLNGEIMEQVECFRYLGSDTPESGRIEEIRLSERGKKGGRGTESYMEKQEGDSERNERGALWYIRGTREDPGSSPRPTTTRLWARSPLP